MEGPSIEQDLIYQLRSTGTSVQEKLQLINSALSSSSSAPFLPQLVRDWTIDLFLKTKTPKDTILSTDWWRVLEVVVFERTIQGQPAAPTLPIFTSFINEYTNLHQSRPDLIRVVTRVWSKWSTTAMRKATIDSALDTYALLLKNSTTVLSKGQDDSEPWKELCLIYLKAFRNIIDLVKGGKKVAHHALSTLSSFLSLLDLLEPESTVHSSLLSTLQTSLFSVENLRKGLARESYHATSGGGGSTVNGDAEDKSTEGAAGELIAALKGIYGSGEDGEKSVMTIVPILTTIYFTSLEKHAATLFPLPSKQTHSTPSATRSAFEIHSLSKRRQLASSWTRGVALLLRWILPPSESAQKENTRSQCLANVLKCVEQLDLHRDGKEEGWEGGLEMIVVGCLSRLKFGDDVYELLAIITRLSFIAIEERIQEVLNSLAKVVLEGEMRRKQDFLDALRDFHSRSISIPLLLEQLSAALSQEDALENNVLTSHQFSSELRSSINGVVPGAGVEETFNRLVDAVKKEMETMPILEKEEDGEGRKKKRRRVSGPGNSSTSSFTPVTGRLRILNEYVKALPTPLPTARFEVFREEVLDSKLREMFGKHVDSSLRKAGAELLATRTAICERLRVEDLIGEAWSIDSKVKKSLTNLVNGDASIIDGHVRVEASRSLLQAIEHGQADSASDILSAVWNNCISSTPQVEWDGYLRGIEVNVIPAALWELISRRYLYVFNSHASEETLASLASTIVHHMSIPSSSTKSLTLLTITHRTLRRADFFELHRLRKHVQAALSEALSIAGLHPPTLVLESLSAKNLPKRLSLIDNATITEKLSAFNAVHSTLPMQFVGKTLRNALFERAIGLDLYISSAHAALKEKVVVGYQKALRGFLITVLQNGSIAAQPVAVISRLLSTALASSIDITIDLYQLLIASAITSFKETTSPARLIELIQSFDRPFGGLSKRLKNDASDLTCEEKAFATLCDSVAANLGSADSLPKDLRESVERAIKAASKPLQKVLNQACERLRSAPSSVFGFADLISASRSMWACRDWLLDGQKAECEDLDILVGFAHVALAAMVSQVVTGSVPIGNVQVGRTCIAVVDLLAYRVGRLRTLGGSQNLSATPFEMLVACHLALAEHLSSADPSILLALDVNLRRATATATMGEYLVALEDVERSLYVHVKTSPAGSAATEATLRVALTLLRNGPEGSSKVGATSLSTILGCLSLMQIRQDPSQERADGEGIARFYLHMAKLLEGVCGDRPTLLSRRNVAAVFGLIIRLFRPSNLSNAVSISSSVASELFFSLISTIAHLVRHRKDHIIPLFHMLTTSLMVIFRALRRSGYGSTGAALDAESVAPTAAAALGKRAEREAAASFPFWIWHAGATTISREHARAVGRLLSSLGAKTTTTIKSHHSHGKNKDSKATSLVAPLSKHVVFLFLPYLKSCVHPTCPIPTALRNEMQPGWFEVMGAMGKWERESLMKGYLKDEDEGERAILKGMWKSYEKERYKG